MKQLVLGILAHVDAGKTTLTEGLLYHGGLLKEVGRVDHKTAYLDTFELERARGITIFSKQARFDWKDIAITLLDTPGHVDFSPEMERVLQVLDYAVLVISAGDGVQSHTRTLWQLLLRHNIPTFLFINKMDLPDTDPSQLMTHLKTELDTGCADFTAEDLFEQVALCEESLFNLYLETGTIPHDTIKSAIQSRHIFPCFFGSALKLDGVDRFLTALSHYMIPLQNEERAMGAQVFKITRDPQGNRLVHLKITSGAIAVKDTIKTDSGEEKINEIRLYSGEKYTTSFSAGVGTICAVTGLSTPNIGDGLGVCPNAHSPTLAPVLTYGISLPKEIDPQVAYLQLKELEEEDPALALRWLADQQKIQIQLMGDVQLDVLRHLVSERFQMEIHFEERTIIYRETISQNEVIEGVGHYEPLCHYAEVLLHLEGGEVGSGIVITSEISCGNLDGNHQNLILSLLENGAHRGVLVGAPLTDLKITLVGGRVHQKHTQGGDLREATHRALRHGLMQATSILLEPWQQISLTLPQDFVGRAMSDIMRMGGSLSEPEYQGELCSLKGSAPVSQLSHYQTTVSSYTAGRGKLSTSFLGYRLCANPSPVLAKSAYSPERDLA
ncbi:MAG: translation factor GTPase family protein, partial [Eubacteriales bacterium]